MQHRTIFDLAELLEKLKKIIEKELFLDLTSRTEDRKKAYDELITLHNKLMLSISVKAESVDNKKIRISADTELSEEEQNIASEMERIICTEFISGETFTVTMIESCTNTNHHHQCPTCSNVWTHDDSCAMNKAAHTCNLCGTVQWHKFF